jgi:hypothetical protein
VVNHRIASSRGTVAATTLETARVEPQTPHEPALVNLQSRPQMASIDDESTGRRPLIKSRNIHPNPQRQVPSFD